MCSVVGYVGTQLGGKLVLNGLLQTEYRGYDSAGFVCLDQQTNNLTAIKSVGFVGDLQKKVESVGIDGRTVLGHTRWATHGGLTEYNAHPHFDCHKNVFVVHNGIIENYHNLKFDLEKKIIHLFRKRIRKSLHMYGKKFSFLDNGKILKILSKRLLDNCVERMRLLLCLHNIQI